MGTLYLFEVVLVYDTVHVYPIPHFVFKGSLADPRLRASNEHFLIVRVPRAGGRSGYASHPSGPRNRDILLFNGPLGPSSDVQLNRAI
jgi:hypothetical protein